MYINTCMYLCTNTYIYLYFIILPLILEQLNFKRKNLQKKYKLKK